MANQYDLTPLASPEEIQKRKLRIMKLRNTGHTFDEVAEIIGKEFSRTMSASQCASDYRDVMKARSKELHEETDSIRASQIFRLQTAVKRVWDFIDREGPSLDHIEMLIKLEARLARLLGTDAPSERVVDDKRDKVQLSESQIKARIAAIYERIQHKGLPEPAIDGEIMPKGDENMGSPVTRPEISTQNQATESSAVAPDLAKDSPPDPPR